ncbi:unnamed protein product [Allacma fusca]|uniref:Uncharacterized protein n=1 Tax=Allacma fusca TaxID=39272 RepID=A0A8J2PGU6_9HEXA|nr:unnamed protein product [Allacma fusca]
MKNVVINSGRVCSPFDLYHSLNHVLQEFSNLPPVVDPFNRRNEVVRRKYGQSIFLEIPDNRTCADAGIGDEYCACTIPVKINSDRADVRMAVEIAIGQINKMVPPQCSKVHLTKIFAAGARERAIQTEFVHLALYTVVFFVDPGHFLFEATLEYRSDVKNFIVKGNVARANPMKTDRSCINDDELERYCYCL